MFLYLYDTFSQSMLAVDIWPDCAKVKNNLIEITVKVVYVYTGGNVRVFYGQTIRMGIKYVDA